MQQTEGWGSVSLGPTALCERHIEQRGVHVRVVRVVMGTAVPNRPKPLPLHGMLQVMGVPLTLSPGISQLLGCCVGHSLTPVRSAMAKIGGCSPRPG